MPVVLGAILNDWLLRIQTKHYDGKPEKNDTVFEVTHRHGNSAASFERTRVIKSILYIIMRKNSTHLQVIPQQSAQNTANLPLQTCASALAPAIIFLT